MGAVLRPGTSGLLITAPRACQPFVQAASTVQWVAPSVKTVEAVSRTIIMSEKGFWGRIFGGQADDQAPTHSFEELHRIHNVLLDPANQVVNAFNKAILIETLRELAELLIWGDQNDPRVFEYFLEHNLLRHYKRILAVPSHRRGGVAVQLLQVRPVIDPYPAVCGAACSY
jgi:hypothetical protein